MNKNQKGFGAVEGLLLLIIVGLIGFVGWYVWNTKNMTDKSLNNASNTKIIVPTEKTASTTPSTTKEPTSYAKYIDIPEWKVRLSFDDADKVTYKITADDSGMQSASLYLKASVTSVESCKALGVGFSRDTKSRGGENDTKIGSYYYRLGGGPGACDGDPGGANGSINQIRGKIDGQELGAGKYILSAIL